MRGQFIGLQRYAMARQVGGASTHHPPHRADFLGHEATIGQFTDANCDIDMLIHQMHDTVGEDQIDIDFRIVREKFGHHWHHMQAPKYDRGSQYQLPFGRCIFATRGALCFADVFKDTAAGSDIGTTRFGQGQLPCGAV